MRQPLPTGVPTLTAPSFYITSRRPLSPGAILLATVAAIGSLSSVLYALGHQTTDWHLAASNRFCEIFDEFALYSENV
jgi:hypothetical protein